MSGVSLKLKYAGTAFVAVVSALLVVIALLAWRQHLDSQRVGALAQSTARARISAELNARADAMAGHAAQLAAAALQSGGTDALARSLQPFLDDATLAAIDVRDTSGRTLFAWHRGQAPPANVLQSRASAPLRAAAGGVSGTPVPWTLGRVQLRLTQVAPPSGGGLAGRLEAFSSADFRTALLLAAILAGCGGLAIAALAWRAGRRVEQPLAALVRSADRIGQGDYSRPLDVARHDEIGALQRALERMRHKLRQTTITKDYLHSVLDGMADAVFVTSPEGNIKVANQTAGKLLGCSAAELIGRNVVTLLDESERASFDLLRAAHDTHETVVRTHAGQTIPVSLTGSQIASDDPQFQGNIFVARNLTERKRAERRIRYLARYDALTKAANRMQFQHLLQQAIARAIRSNHAVALLYLDMDRFKEVNDTFGHGSGDRVLEVLAERLARTLPKGTIVGRLAGDEFALFVEGLPPDSDNRGPIAHLARSILTEVNRAFQLNEHEVFLTASIGIAFCPRDAENVIDLIRNADAAMYYSKQNGGNTFAFYSPEMNAAAVERLILKSKLRRALERDELVIRYQPKVDLRNGRIVGAEALLRWRLPGHGDIPPGKFIPIAEETNLILDIGEWVLNRVCMDYRQMRNEVADPGRISLNLSLRQLRQASFILRCRSVFRRHGVSPTSLELEITETTLMTDTQRTVRLLDELYAMGLHLSIDDFGTGYSSLSALQQFPIGTLKIDQSFVRDVSEDAGDATIVRTIIDMGRSLGMEVIAEGIETQRHLEFLRNHHCHFGQGKLFGEPLSCEDLLARLARQANGAAPFAHLLPREAVAGRLA